MRRLHRLARRKKFYGWREAGTGAWEKTSIIILVVFLFTGITFRLFPDILSASNVITVFTGLIGSILVVIQLHEHFVKISGK